MKQINQFDPIKLLRNSVLLAASIPLIFALQLGYLLWTVPLYFGTQISLESALFLNFCLWSGTLALNLAQMLLSKAERSVRLAIDPERADRHHLEFQKKTHRIVIKRLFGEKRLQTDLLIQAKAAPIAILRTFCLFWVASAAAPFVIPNVAIPNLLAYSALYYSIGALLHLTIGILTTSYEENSKTKRTGGQLTDLWQEAQEEENLKMHKLNLAVELEPSAANYIARAEGFKKKTFIIDAIEDYDKAIAIDPSSVTAYEGRADLYQLLSLYYLARCDLMTAERLSQGDEKKQKRIKEKLDDLASRSNPHHRMRNPREACALTGTMLSSNTKHIDNVQLEQVENDLQKFKESALLHHRHAALLYNNQKYEGALVSINKAIEERDDCADYYVMRAKIELQLSNLEACARDIEKAIELDDKNTAAHEERARLLVALGEYDAAVEECSQAMTFTKNYQFKYLRALALIALNRNSEAVEDLSDFIQKWQLFIAMWDALWLPIFRRIAQDLRVQLRSAYEQRSIAYSKMGNMEKAAQDMIKANKLKQGKSTWFWSRS